jgi:flagellum-specific peptidoglycan hydrolase FlgJ
MRKLFLLIFLPLSIFVFGQNKNSQYSDYIDQYKDIAIREMKNYGIPASITLAQGLLESGAGKSQLTMESNNHFGIKCQKNWTGATVYYDDDQKHECFRKYNAALESYEDHSQFLKNNSRYASLFKLDVTDYKGWAAGLKQAGYATNPNYAPQLIKIIEDYNLSVYDTGKGVKEKVSKEKSTDKTVEAPKKKRSLWEILFGRKKDKKEDPPKDQTKNSLSRQKKDTAFIAEIPAYRTHVVKKINGVKYVEVLQGDSYESIAEEFDMFEKELLKANELQYGATPQPGDIVFLSKKKGKGDEEAYTVQQGETMYQISQKKGIKVRSLYRLNNLVYGKSVNPGDVIKLR